MGTTDRQPSSGAESAMQPGPAVAPPQPGAQPGAEVPSATPGASPSDTGPGAQPSGRRAAGRPATERVFIGTGWFWSLIIGIVLALAAVIFVLQNGDPVSVEFLGWEGEVSLAGLVLVVALAAIVLDELFGAFYRHRRRRRLTERAATDAPPRRISR